MQLPMPVAGEEIYNLWDFAYGDTRSNDYCVGVFVSVNRVYQAHVHALVAEKFTPSELARQVVLMAHRTRPKAVMYEHIVGSDFLEMEARKLATELGFHIPLSPFKTDKGPNAKAVRIAALEPLLKGGRLFFSNTLQNYDLLMKQFTDFTGERTNKKHDDIPDAISFIRRILPMTGLELPASTPAINGTQLTQNIFTFEQNAMPVRDFNFDTFMRQQGQQQQAPPVVAKPKRDGQPNYGLDILN
jgi:predicted phage terminase large subunit-like protein